MDGTAITALRTGAGSALATRLLARENAATIAILGTGVQARSHAHAVTRVRAFEELRVAGRSRPKTEALATELSGELDLRVRAAASWEEACDSADVVCATTHALEPVVRREWITPGVHVTSVGYNPQGREVDDATVVDALVVVESRAAALAPFPSGSNDLLQPIERRLISDGMYRYIRHPNYLAVILEFAAVPLVAGAWISAVVLSALNAIVLVDRISAEEGLLNESAVYRRAFAGRARFIPGVF